MKNKKIYQDIPSLLSKALLATLSEEEEERLREWKDQSEVNARLYQHVMKQEFVENKCKEVSRVNIVEGYMGVIRKRKRHVKERQIKRIISFAAGILLPLLVVLLWVENKGEKQVPEQMAQVIRHGEVKAELVLADGTTRLLSKELTDSLFSQQGANILVQERGLNYQGDTSSVEEIRYNTLRVPRGGEYTITLSDGTVIYMNSESELRYPVKFAGNERKVFLSGEAYFEVTEDKAHPFIVGLGSSSVKVLGTKFDVRAYKDENEVLTTLVQGSVAFSAGKERVVLKPGEQAVLNGEGEIETREVDTYLYTAWKDGVFAFKQQRLEEIMKVIARWYDVNVFWENSSQKEITFSGKMQRYDDFSKVVEMLEMTGNTEFEIKENNIFIREQ